MEHLKAIQSRSSEFLTKAAKGGDVKIMKYLVEELHLDLSKCICECLISAYDNEHREMMDYLIGMERLRTMENLGPFLQTVIRRKDIDFVCWILNMTKTKPTIHDVELAIEKQDIHILKLLTQDGYEEEYYSNVIKNLEIDYTKQRDFKQRVIKEIIPCSFSRVSTQDNALLITCLTQLTLDDWMDCYKVVDCVKGIMTHPKFILTPSLRNPLVKFRDGCPKCSYDVMKMIADALLKFNTEEK